jgi:hypothetical protein
MSEHFLGSYKGFESLAIFGETPLDLFFMPASFGSGNDVPASLPNNNKSKGRWTQEEHKIFV